MSEIPNKKRIQELSEKWIDGTITDAEREEYDQWYSSFEDFKIYDLTERDLITFLDEKYGCIKETEGIGSHSLRKGKIQRRVLLIAVSISLFILSSTYFYSSFFESNNQSEGYYSSILPGKDRATLVLDNGKVFNLDSLSSGEILLDAGVRIEKTVEGKLVYSIVGPAIYHTDVVMNTVSTPKGGQYRVSLPDGSQVWLNAASSLTFPSAFTGKSRTVELSGEAYFEVVENRHLPFEVITENEKVEVLGTHFNVSSYKEDGVSSVALLEGKVKVSVSSNKSRILSPGQQTIVSAGSIQVQPVDISEAAAWKNGEFMFNNESLKSVMKKIARWYDVEIVVAPELGDISIWGSISRYDHFGKVFKIIELIDETIQIKVDGRRVEIVR